MAPAEAPPTVIIANKLGYRDYSAFSHAFRSWTGYSPREYRESEQRGEQAI